MVTPAPLGNAVVGVHSLSIETNENEVTALVILIFSLHQPFSFWYLNIGLERVKLLSISFLHVFSICKSGRIWVSNASCAYCCFSCSRNGSKCVYQGEKLSPFPFVLPFCAPFFVLRRWNCCQVLGSSFQIWFQCCLSNVWRYFFHFVASEEFNHFRLKYPLSCMGLTSGDWGQIDHNCF